MGRQALLRVMLVLLGAMAAPAQELGFPSLNITSGEELVTEVQAVFNQQLNLTCLLPSYISLENTSYTTPGRLGEASGAACRPMHLAALSNAALHAAILERIAPGHLVAGQPATGGGS